MTNAEVRAMLRGDPPTKPIILTGAQQLGLPATPRMTKEQILLLIDGHLAGLPQGSQCPWQPPRLAPLPAPAPAPAPMPAPAPAPVPAGPTREEIEDRATLSEINRLIIQWSTAVDPAERNRIRGLVLEHKTHLHDRSLFVPELPEIPVPPATPPTLPPATPPATPPAQPEEKKSFAKKIFGRKLGKKLDDLDKGGIG